MDIRIPEPLKLEHQELHEELVRATKTASPTGCQPVAEVSSGMNCRSPPESCRSR